MDAKIVQKYNKNKTVAHYPVTVPQAIIVDQNSRTLDKDLQKLAGIAEGANKVTKTSELTNDSGFLTAHQDISGKADKTYVDTELGKKQNTISDLSTIRSGASAGATAVQPSAISDMETKTHAAATYQPKGNYLTSHQSLANYYTKTEIDSMITATLTANY